MGVDLSKIKPAVIKAKEVATVADIETAEDHFNTAIALTNSYISAINNTLSDIASDAKLTAGEKQTVKREWETIVAEKTSLVNQAASFGVPSTSYTGKYDALNSYLNIPIGSALLTSLTTTSEIVSSTFTTTFKEYYTAKIDLLNAVATKAKDIADSKVNSTYVTTAIANSGYVLPAEVAAAVNNNETKIEGSKIVTGSLLANSINANSIMANTISGDKLFADALYGKTIVGANLTGGVINGAYIKGAIIEASYILQPTTSEGLSDYRGVDIGTFVALSGDYQTSFIAAVKPWADLAQYEKNYFSNNEALYKGRVPVLDNNQKCFLPFRSPCVWQATNPSLSLGFGSYYTGTIGATYFDFTPYDDYTSSNRSNRCQKLSPLLTFSSLQLCSMTQGNDKWAPCQIGIKMVDRVIVFHWAHGDAYLQNGYKVFTSAGFPLTQNSTADGQTSKQWGTNWVTYSSGSAILLESNISYTYDRYIEYTYGSFTLCATIGLSTYNGINITLKHSTVTLSNFTSSNIMATDPKAYGVLFMTGSAMHDAVWYSANLTMPAITVT